MFGSRSVKNFFSGFAWLLMFAPLLAYPLAFGKMWRGRVPFFGEVPGVDFSVLALLAAGCVTVALPMLFRLLERDRGIRLLVAGGGLGCLAVLLQQGMFGMNLVALLSGIGYFLLPIAGLLLARELRRLLPAFFTILFLVCATITLREILSGQFAVGLAGNWNWNWTLLTISVPALAFVFREWKWRFRTGGVLAVAVAVGQFFLCGDYSSRGTLIAGVAAGAVLFLAGFLHRRPERCRLAATLGIPLLLVAGSVIYYGLRSGTFAEQFPEENRLMLWQGSIALAESHWLSGVGQDRYEGEIAPFLPESYFDSDFASDRHPHPHNELLFYWCGFGVIGILWWLLLLGVGIYGAISRRSRDGVTLLALWGWWVLFFHGQVDVLLQTPLAGGIFLILTGVLAGMGRERVRIPIKKILPIFAAGFVLLAVMLFSLNLFSGWYCRSGKLALLAGDPETARRNFRHSIAIRPSAEGLYTLATVELFDFRNPKGAVEILQRIPEELRLSSYSHSSGRMARALAAGGKPEEALPFFAAEQRNFPRSAVNLILWQTVIRQLGRTAEADEMLAAWQKLLQYKGITQKEFPYLMQNQQLDDSPLELRLFLKEMRK